MPGNWPCGQCVGWPRGRAASGIPASALASSGLARGGLEGAHLWLFDQTFRPLSFPEHHSTVTDKSRGKVKN